MEFSQKRNGIKTRLIFNEDKLDYLVSENGNKSGGTMAYEKISSECTYRKPHRYWKINYIAAFFFFMGLLCAAMGLKHGVMNSVYIVFIFTAAAAMLCAITYFARSPMLTILQGEPNIIIIHDQQYSVIMDEINKHRNGCLRKKFMEIDYLSPPARESAKFRFLRNEDVITDREYKEAISKLIASQQKPNSFIS